MVSMNPLNPFRESSLFEEFMFDITFAYLIWWHYCPFQQQSHDLPTVLLLHLFVQTSQIMSIIPGNQTRDHRFESDQMSILSLGIGYWDKISRQNLSICSLFPIAVNVKALAMDCWSLYHGKHESSEPLERIQLVQRGGPEGQDCLWLGIYQSGIMFLPLGHY